MFGCRRCLLGLFWFFSAKSARFRFVRGAESSHSSRHHHGRFLTQPIWCASVRSKGNMGAPIPPVPQPQDCRRRRSKKLAVSPNHWRTSPPRRFQTAQVGKTLYYIGFLPRLLYPPLRLILIHVLSCLLVLWHGWTQEALTGWQLFVKVVFLCIYGLYLPASLLLFLYAGCCAREEQYICTSFLVMIFKDRLDATAGAAGDPRDVRGWPGLRARPGNCTCAIFRPLIDNKNHVWLGVIGLGVLGSVSLSCCLLPSSPGFWDYMGGLLRPLRQRLPWLLLLALSVEFVYWVLEYYTLILFLVLGSCYGELDLKRIYIFSRDYSKAKYNC